MTNAINRLYTRQPSTNITSVDGKRYQPFEADYQVGKEWLVTGLGYKEVDLNAAANSKTGVFGYPIFDYVNGQRGGPVITYMQAALKKTNFVYRTGAQVVRVERTGGQATGITVTYGGQTLLIKTSAKGKVILSGGALQSPSLLYYSGIGPASTLQQLKGLGKLNQAPQNWINNSAVGAGLFDNPNTFIELESPNALAYSYSYSSPNATDKALYLQKRSGPYSLAGQTSVFWDSSTRSDGTVAGFQGTIGSSGYADYTSNHTITLNIYGTSGLKSRGYVGLDNNGVPGSAGGVYYSVPSDSLEIATYIKKIFAKLPTTLMPKNMDRNWTVDQINTYITKWSAYAVGQVNHWSSSCKIGTCVDEYTRVVGMSNLHVVDASILEPLTVNPQFGVMAAAERASEYILNLFAQGK